ncbi:hypothetical protein [Kitasatospora sp. NPDC001547]|uniref:hypothetical protein n=1 Tax=Kitasatospora sp. NPDC001547 TaxID=3364015 RepID=UPI00369C68D6
MMPTETIMTPALGETADSDVVSDVKTVTTRQESAPIGRKGEKGFHIFTITLGVDPQGGKYEPGVLKYELKAPSGWYWVKFASYYYDEKEYKATAAKILDATVEGRTLSFSLDSHLNTGKDGDKTRLCFTVMADPEKDAEAKLTSDGKVTVTGDAGKKIPAVISLSGVVTA